MDLFLKQFSRFFSVYYNFRYKRNRAFEQSILKSSSSQSSSSTSDTSEFREINSLYSSSDIMFNKFRRSFHYSKILEHVDYETGLLYIKQIILLNPDYYLINRFKFALRNEKGKPNKFLFRTFGWSSPSTIRYIKIYLEIKRIFDGVKLKRIVEIGGGYGGQARIFSLAEGFQEYVIVDLPEVIELQKKYLSPVPNIKFISAFESNNDKSNFIEYDLLISNFAFSELDKRTQDLYLEKYIRRSAHGYMIWNNINPPGFSYNLKEVLDLIPNSDIKNEIPLTDKDNFLIFW